VGERLWCNGVTLFIHGRTATVYSEVRRGFRRYRGYLVQGEDEMKRMVQAVALLIGLFVVVFAVANWWVGGGSSATVVDVARSKCVKDGFPAQTMLAQEIDVDSNMFGFGGRATVVFFRDGKIGRDGRIIEFTPDGQRIPIELRVELRRGMNLMEWEAVSVVEGKGQ
jgi:hypothetical protein